MSDWRAGYVEGIDYTYGHYLELNPLRAKLAFLHAGLAVPEFTTACELGFGQGVSINLNAAASAIRWHGTDFDPSQAGFARDLAEAAGAGAALFDDSFADFARRPDLPDFDFIGMHGIWSWVSDENRAVIIDFIRRKLKVGGVLYASYNTLPGWAPFVPMRHLLSQHATRMGSAGRGTVERIDGALDFAEKLLATNPRYARPELRLGERLTKIKEQSRHYLAHEYFNRDWAPMHFSTIAEWLAPAKLQFACSANYVDHIDSIHLSEEQMAFLNEIPDAALREDVRDFMLDRQFRADYWVKGPRRLSMTERSDALQKLRFVLFTPKTDEPLKITTARGEVTMDEARYVPILDALADHKPKSLAQLDHLLRPTGISTPNLVQAIMILAGKGIILQVQDDAAVKKAWPASERLNTHILARSRSHENVLFLASPVTGGGVPVNRAEQLFLLARDNGGETPAELAAFAWRMLSANGQKMIKDGKPLDTAEEHVEELGRMADVFLAKKLPVLTALQVA